MTETENTSSATTNDDESTDHHGDSWRSDSEKPVTAAPVSLSQMDEKMINEILPEDGLNATHRVVFGAVRERAGTDQDSAFGDPSPIHSPKSESQRLPIQEALISIMHQNQSLQKQMVTMEGNVAAVVEGNKTLMSRQSEIEKTCTRQENILSQVLSQQQRILEMLGTSQNRHGGSTEKSLKPSSEILENQVRPFSPATSPSMQTVEVPLGNPPTINQPMTSISSEPASPEKEPSSSKWAKVRRMNTTPNPGTDQAEDPETTDCPPGTGAIVPEDRPRRPSISSATNAKLVAVSAFNPDNMEKLRSRGTTSFEKSPKGAIKNKKTVSKRAFERERTAIEIAKQSGELTTWQTLHYHLDHVVSHAYFSHFFGLAIVANSICIGLQADAVASDPGAPTPAEFTALETFFCMIFLLEIVLRIIVEQKEFFMSKECKWNYFDLWIVALAVFEEFSRLIGSGTDTNFTFVRILRILRITRIIRLIRVLKEFRELRVLINSIMGSMMSLLWTVLLLIVMLYCVGVFVTQVVAEYRSKMLLEDLGEDHQRDLDEMSENYGSVLMAIYTLFQAMSGGVDWGDAARPLVERINFMFAPFFCCYIAFGVFCVLNIVTGVFVNEAMMMAGRDQEFIIDQELNRHDSDVNEFKRMFHEADEDESGTLSWDEFERHMDDPRVDAYFKTLDLNIPEAKQLFMLLDHDRTGEISIDEFVNGCSKFKGQARSIDIHCLMYESKTIMEQTKMLHKAISTSGKNDDTHSTSKPASSKASSKEASGKFEKLGDWKKDLANSRIG